MAIEKSKLDELRAQHGEVFEVNVGGMDIVFRPASEPEYFKCLSDGAKDPKLAPKAVYDLAHKCVVHPPLSEFGALVARRPGVALKVGNEVLRVANGEEAELAGKA